MERDWFTTMWMISKWISVRVRRKVKQTANSAFESFECKGGLFREWHAERRRCCVRVGVYGLLSLDTQRANQKFGPEQLSLNGTMNCRSKSDDTQLRPSQARHA